MKSKKKNLAEKIVNFLLNILIVIFGFILLISIYTGIQTKILGNDNADFFGYSIFEVQTGSMADAINAGDCIIVKRTQKVKLNDIITYKKSGEFITHRVIEVYNGTYITKGDANNAKDEPIDQKQIVGKVVNIWSGFGILRKTLFNPIVLMAIIITLFLFNLAFKKNKVDDKNNSKISKNETGYIFLDNMLKKIALIFSNIIKKSKNNIKKIKPISNKTNEVVENSPKITDINPINIMPKKATTEDYYKDEDELEKTSLYRVIPVNAAEVGEKYKEAPTKVSLEDHYKDEDEMDKTSLFRMIPVDATEVNDTFLEIAQNEIKEAGQNNNKEVAPEATEEVVENTEPEDLTNINLELLKNKRKKSKNIIDTVMLVRKEELEELINIITQDDKTYINKETVKDMFVNAYIDIKYYNCYGDKEVERSTKNPVLKIENVLKETIPNAIKLIKDEKAKDIAYKYANIFLLIANLEQARDSINDSKARHEFYKKEIKKYAKDWDINKIEKIIEELTKVQKSYFDTLEYFLKRLETSMFDLNFNKLVTKKDIYGLELLHNLSFSKIYSEYIIDKTYKEGVVAEDKMSVLLTLLSVQLIKDMTSPGFNKKYIFYIPNSLYTKEKKLDKILKMIDDKYAKDNAIILLTFEDLLRNEKIIKEIRKLGYKFALAFNQETALNETNRGNMFIANYIFINKQFKNKAEIVSYVPAELLNHIVYEDIFNKVGDVGGEQ